jgi:ubiquinone/menaquinone biosynthesis C-methylase UbiE
MTFGYGRLSTEVYDLDKPIGTSFGDVEYYKHSLTEVDGRVLEPAVGTGRVLIPLLQAGIDVDGYDSSPEMLALCRERCREHGLDPALSDGDMTTFRAPGEYAAVIVPAGSITLLDGQRELMRALDWFHECLQLHGRLVVDVPAPVLSAEPEAMRHWAAGEFVWTLQTMHVAYDPAANQTTRWLRYEKWHAGSLIATELQVFRLQHWSITEFTNMLVTAGFVHVTVTADYDPKLTPNAASDLWTFSAEKKPWRAARPGI